ncbi:MAG: hypothetical protein HYY43_01715 [Deltaproteobacteria bacterium]|nr:hypothetical protein [Deltaproteobacteria bacterium]
MNPQFPGNSAVASKEEMDIQIADGKAKEEDRFIMPSALILDPFDEETIKDEAGNILTAPSDGVTGVYRKIDTHAVGTTYDNPFLPDYTSLLFDSTAKAGEQGMFFDYPNLPDDLKIAGLRVFTAALSYPGPLVSPQDRFDNVSQCEQVDPCNEEGQRRLGEGPKDKSKKGVCAFFYASGASWDSPSMHKPSEMEGGELKDYCKSKGEAQKLNDITGTYDLSGEMTYGNVGLRFWGPTYFHNPAGPLGSVPPLDEILHLTFTTGVLQPSKDESASDLIPDKRINISKLEHKINLTDTTLEMPRLCDNSVKNRLIRGEYYSTWKYLAPLLVKDEEGKIPAGCPEAGNSFTGGSAFIRGRPLDQETGIMTLVGGAKFSSSDNLTFAFKDVILFIVFNGWVCDPAGSESEFEGARCFDREYNDRDGASGITIMK